MEDRQGFTSAEREVLISLTTLTANMTGLREEVRNVSTELKGSILDHEGRLRSLEREIEQVKGGRRTLMGVITVLGAVSSVAGIFGAINLFGKG